MKSKTTFRIYGTALVCAMFFAAPTLRAATAVDVATSSSIDSDGDGVPDLTDNAPSFSNPAQFDTDGDGVGDVIDTDPGTYGPIVDIGFSIGGTYFVSPGAGVTVNFTTTHSPAGNYGHINLYLPAGDISPDAYAFQSLATPGGSFFIPANLFTLPGQWDLNTPGTYTLEAWAFGPGNLTAGYKGGEATIVVQPVPEPATVGVLSLGCIAMLRRRRK